MITSRTAQTRDDANWVHGCFTVQVGETFDTYLKIVQYAEQGEYSTNSGSSPALEPNAQTVMNSIQTDAKDENGALPIYFSRTKCRDSSLGGNDAINPLPQFCEDDDISHPHFVPKYGNTDGMGQVYSENYDDTQQILYMGFGIPVFTNLGNFWSQAVDKEMAGFVNKGSGITAEKIGFLLGRAPVNIVKIATIPSKFIASIVDGLQYVPITKYYAFSSQMPMYFRFVNIILVSLATNMGMMGSSTEINETGSDTSNVSSLDLLEESADKGDDMSGISKVFQKSGLDMAQIMAKRFYYEHGDNSITQRYTDQALFKASALNDKNGSTPDVSATTSTNPTPNDTNSNTTATDGTTTTPAPTGDTLSGEDTAGRNWTMTWFDAFAAAYGTAIYDGHLFVGFRIDKGMGTSESFSNSTGESTVAAAANAKFQEGRDMSFNTMEGKFGSSFLGNLLTNVTSGFKDLFEGAAKAIKIDPLAAVATGAAKVDIPDVWQGSNYSRSASFSITCLSPYGDMESIFQSEYVPLACMLAGTLPRGTGHASHSAPFICQAYCRGVFSSPLCIVESLEVSRGADQFGFSFNRLPLKITMHITLKDLTPSIYMSMGGNQGIAKALLGTDDNFGEYMLTLSGMGLRDRLAPFRAIRRKTKILLSTIYENKLSPFMLGMEGGSRFTVSRMISAVKSGGKGLINN